MIDQCADGRNSRVSQSTGCDVDTTIFRASGWAGLITTLPASPVPTDGTSNTALRHCRTQQSPKSGATVLSRSRHPVASIATVRVSITTPSGTSPTTPTCASSEHYQSGYKPTPPASRRHRWSHRKWQVARHCSSVPQTTRRPSRPIWEGGHLQSEQPALDRQAIKQLPEQRFDPPGAKFTHGHRQRRTTL